MKRAGSAGEILVVDDDPRFLEFVRGVAARLNLSCTTVRFGEEALRLLTKREFRLLILDGLLPGMRGEDVARKARERFEKQDLPILFCSAFYRDLRSFRHLMGACGISMILHKPLDEERLAQAIRQLVELGPEGGELEEEDPAERAALHASYLAASLEKVAAMQRALQASHGSAAYLTALQMEAHRFRGSGTSFELPEVTRIGGAIEDLLIPLEGGSGTASPSLLARLEGLVGALETTLRQAAGDAPFAPARLPGFHPRILLLDDEESALAGQIQAHAADGLPIWLCADEDEALKRVLEHQVEVVFLAADRGEPQDELLSRCKALRDIAQISVILLAHEDSVPGRLAALEAGAKAYVARPADVDGLFRIASIYTEVTGTGPALLVGPDGLALAQFAERLADLGRAAVPCTDGDSLFEALEENRPSLVVLDGEPDWERSLALARMLRGDLRYRGLPILVAMNEPSGPQVSTALAAGATACVAKPISLLELQPVLSSWVVQGWERERSLFGVDVQTGLMDRRNFEVTLDRSLGLAKREGHALSVMGIDMGLGRLRREEGGLIAEGLAATLAAQLRASLRSSDVVARLGGDRLVAILQGAAAEDGARILKERLGAFGEALGSKVALAGPVGAVRTFPDLRGRASRFMDQLEAALDAQVPGDRWEEELVVEVEEAPDLDPPI